MNRYLINFRFALHSLFRQRAFVLVFVLTLGVTVSSVFSVFSLYYTMNHQPLPYPNDDTLYLVKSELVDDQGNVFTRTLNYPNLVNVYRNQNQLSKTVIFTGDSDVIASLSNQPKVRVTFTTHELDELLGIPMQKGLFISAEQGMNRFEPVAVISHKVWTQEFAAREDILEQSLTMRGKQYKIIGVVSEAYYEPQLLGVSQKTDIWLPWDFNNYRAEYGEDWGNFQGVYFMIGNIKPGLDINSANQYFTDLAHNTWKAENEGSEFGQKMSVHVELQPLRDAILGDFDSVGVLLLVGVLGLLLVAAANLSNTVLSRIAQLSKEFAIRATLGAKSPDIFVRFLCETLTLSFISGVVGLLIGMLLIDAMKVQLADSMPMIQLLDMGAALFLFAFITMLIMTLLFASLTLFSVNYNELIAALRGGGKGLGVQVSSRVRKVLVISQLSIAIVLLFGNLILFKDALTELNQDIGFESENMFAVSFFFRTETPPDDDTRISVSRELVEMLEATAEVESMGYGRAPFYSGGRWTFNEVDSNAQYFPNSGSIDEKFVSLVGLDVEAGNNLTREHVVNDEPYMLVNRSFADALPWGDEVIGKTLMRFGFQPFQVIGIVEDFGMPGEDKNKPRAFIPGADKFYYFILKTSGDNKFSRPWLVKQAKELHPMLSVYNYESFTDKVTQARKNIVLLATITAALALLVSLLTVVGLLGVIGFSTKLRNLEIAIRMSIGAKFSHLLTMFAKENFSLNLVAVAISMFIIAVVATTQDMLQIDLSLPNVLFFILAILVVGVLLFVACLVPLLKIQSQDIISTLRQE